MLISGSFLGFDNKFWEFQTEKWESWSNFFHFECGLSKNCDHAGFRLNAEICGYWFEFQIYDCRHWDYEKKDWASNNFEE